MYLLSHWCVYQSLHSLLQFQQKPIQFPCFAYSYDCYEDHWITFFPLYHVGIIVCGVCLVASLFLFGGVVYMGLVYKELYILASSFCFARKA